MAERFFPNGMPGYVEDSSSSSAPCLHALLSLPYPALADRFLRAALQLKQRATDCIAPPSITGFAHSSARVLIIVGVLCHQVVHEAWENKQHRAAGDFHAPPGRGARHRVPALQGLPCHRRSGRPCHLRQDRVCLRRGVCGGGASVLGRFVGLVWSLVTGLTLSIWGSCSLVTFICGRAGVSSLGVVVAKHTGYENDLSRYLSSFKQITVKFPDELLYGKAGYLWACSFLNKHVGKNMIEPTTTDMIIRETIKDGRRLSTESCPLMYEWYGEKYWGAAHGLAGIMHVLLDMELAENEREYVKGTLWYMIQNRFPSGGVTLGLKEIIMIALCTGAIGLLAFPSP